MGLFRKKESAQNGGKVFKRPTISDVQPQISLKMNNLNNYVIIILDSCRFDTWIKAQPQTMMKLGNLECRYSYASWTAPSHYNLLMGLFPHTSPSHVYASDYYKKDFIKFKQRFGTDAFEFKNLVPTLYLPPFLQNKLGYKTHAMVSLPVLNPQTPVNFGFDTFTLMDKHNDMAAMLDKMHFSDEYPSFYLLNIGETHYPYALPDEPESEWPRISGVHGVFKHLDDHIVGGKLVEDDNEKFFDQKKLDQLYTRQIHAVKYIDTIVERLFDMLPPNTYVTITSDHGELFGEDGFFGHGPIMHEKVFQVPFIEGKLR